MAPDICNLCKLDMDIHAVHVEVRMVNGIWSEVPTGWDCPPHIEIVREEGNLVKHARYELNLLGEEPRTVEGYIRMIQIFSEMDHSGGSASVFIPTLNTLLRLKNLTPLTNNPNEWMDVAEEVWQNTRNSEAFSNDGGKTYYLLSEGGNDKHCEPLHRSEEYTS